MIISAKIDVTKIDKARLYKGEKGTYLNCALIETPNSEFSDYMIVQDVTKEEREAGKKGEVLGNAKVFVFKQVVQAESEVKNDVDENDDVPF